MSGLDHKGAARIAREYRECGEAGPLRDRTVDRLIDECEQDDATFEALLAQHAAMREALERTPQAVYDEIVEECGHTMAIAAAHAAKTQLRAALSLVEEGGDRG